MPVGRASAQELTDLDDRISAWAGREAATNPLVLAVERPEASLADGAGAAHRWFVRLAGEEKQVCTVRLLLRERTLRSESHFVPAPEENREQLFEYLLRLNATLFAVRFAIGEEDAVYLVGQLPWSAVDDEELDRLVGATYAASEQYFRPAMRIGFASRFRG
ncbi:MAG TPA: YbjN domain-containing protein [Acidimicrobiales bacterium]|nr:YbjN domain-containing protein [Acidimicrobiales bacterium]